MRRRNAAVGVIATITLAVVALSGSAVSGSAGAASIARVVDVTPHSSFHLNKAGNFYFGTMEREITLAGLGGGVVPAGLSHAARLACWRLYATGLSKGLYPHVQLLWYRGTQTVGAIANFGSAPTHFDGHGNWRTGGINSPSISKGDRFVAIGAFFDSSLQRALAGEDTATTYAGRPIRVECFGFRVSHHWPF